MDGNLRQTMKNNLDNSDAVIFFLTPLFKDKVKDIAKKFDITNENQPEGNLQFEVWNALRSFKEKELKISPMILKGDFASSCPPGIEEFLVRSIERDNLYHDLLSLSNPLGFIPSLMGLPQGHKKSKEILEKYEKIKAEYIINESESATTKAQSLVARQEQQQRLLELLNNGQRIDPNGDNDKNNNSINNQYTNSNSFVVVVEGEGGSGKTALVEMVAREKHAVQINGKPLKYFKKI